MSEKFTIPLYVRCPPSMISLIETVADKQFTTVSDYVRRAVVAQLRADGFATDVMRTL